jgi:hypothetical protein
MHSPPARKNLITLPASINQPLLLDWTATHPTHTHTNKLARALTKPPLNPRRRRRPIHTSPDRTKPERTPSGHLIRHTTFSPAGDGHPPRGGSPSRSSPTRAPAGAKRAMSPNGAYNRSAAVKTSAAKPSVISSGYGRPAGARAAAPSSSQAAAASTRGAPALSPGRAARPASPNAHPLSPGRSLASPSPVGSPGLISPPSSQRLGAGARSVSPSARKAAAAAPKARAGRPPSPVRSATAAAPAALGSAFNIPPAAVAASAAAAPQNMAPAARAASLKGTGGSFFYEGEAAGPVSPTAASVSTAGQAFSRGVSPANLLALPPMLDAQRGGFGGNGDDATLLIPATASAAPRAPRLAQWSVAGALSALMRGSSGGGNGGRNAGEPSSPRATDSRLTMNSLSAHGQGQGSSPLNSGSTFSAAKGLLPTLVSLDAKPQNMQLNELGTAQSPFSPSRSTPRSPGGTKKKPKGGLCSGRIVRCVVVPLILAGLISAVVLAITLSEAAKAKNAQARYAAANPVTYTSVPFEVETLVPPPPGAPLGWGCSTLLGDDQVRRRLDSFDCRRSATYGLMCLIRHHAPPAPTLQYDTPKPSLSPPKNSPTTASARPLSPPTRPPSDCPRSPSPSRPTPASTSRGSPATCPRGGCWRGGCCRRRSSR